MAKKANTPKGGFNFYWIYGIVAVVIFMLMLTSSGSTGNNNYLLFIADNGDVSIGTNDAQGYNLAVKGRDGIIAEEVTVKLHGNWPDFVFKKDYGLMSLNDVEAYITENSHLPNVPSEKEIQEDGIKLGEMDAVLLRKIEELTLYTLEQQKLIDQLSSL